MQPFLSSFKLAQIDKCQNIVIWPKLPKRTIKWPEYYGKA